MAARGRAWQEDEEEEEEEEDQVTRQARNLINNFPLSAQITTNRSRAGERRRWYPCKGLGYPGPKNDGRKRQPEGRAKETDSRWGGRERDGWMEMERKRELDRQEQLDGNKCRTRAGSCLQLGLKFKILNET